MARVRVRPLAHRRTKTTRVLSFLCLVFCVVFLLFSFHSYRASTVVSVPDGDSMDLSDGRRIRLLGLDAPERGRCGADEARMRLESLVLGRHVRLKDTVRDSYGRQLATVILETPEAFWTHLVEWLKWKFRLPHKTPLSTNWINRVMVEEGLAKYHGSGMKKAKTLKLASEVARASKIGIYSPRCLQTVPPDSSCFIKGNIRNNEKTYHLPWCDNYDQTIIDTSYGDQWFCTEKEAISEGFERASGCREK